MKQTVLGILIAFGILVGGAAQASAQTPIIAGDKLAFDVQTASLAEAQAAVYKHYDDASATGIVLTPVTCSAQVPPLAGNFTCETPFPAFTPGVAHGIALTASNLAGESLRSTVFSFQLVVIPSAPTNLRRKS